jgi:glycine/D-amino acid oxidase-like deaminating enzyme
MAGSIAQADAVVIGGGFYGCEIALELRRLGLERITLLEREKGIMRRASAINQARIHNGYHYPRSIVTAARSHENFDRFLSEYTSAVTGNFESIYAIAFGSRVNASQYERFCATIGIPCSIASVNINRLFDHNLIEATFKTNEQVFDVKRMIDITLRRIDTAGIDLQTGIEGKIDGAEEEFVKVTLPGGAINAAYVFNCTYAEIDAAGVSVRPAIKRELAELLIIDPPSQLEHLGVTVMDGPFFSIMPFPPAGRHTLSHVRYTPHEAWFCAHDGNIQSLHSNRDAMLRDAARYLPCLSKAKVVRSVFEIKAVLHRNEDDDGRPILFERCSESPRIFSIMGAKLDNIFDIQEQLRTLRWRL